MLVLATFVFVCIGSIFFLPDRLSSSRGRVQPGETDGAGAGVAIIGARGAEGEDADRAGGKVYKVYKELREAGREFILPPPPLDQLDNPNVRHGVLDGPDPHRVDDRARLMAQVEMDSAVEELRRRQQQQVLQRPNLDPDKDNARKSSPSSSSSPSPPAKKKKKKPDPAFPSGPRKPPSGSAVQEKKLSEPMVQGGDDPDPEMKQRRNKVAEVSWRPTACRIKFYACMSWNPFQMVPEKKDKLRRGEGRLQYYFSSCWRVFTLTPTALFTTMPFSSLRLLQVLLGCLVCIVQHVH